MTEPDRGGCPYCGDVSGLQRVACESLKVDAWRCAACGGQCWCSVANHPQLYLDQLAVDMAARSVLRGVEALAAEAPGLSDEALRARLLISLITLAQHAGNWPG